MLKRIAPVEVRLGMYIVSFDGRWLAHPFWRTRFHVLDPADLQRVHASKVDAVVIDPARTVATVPPGTIAAMPICVANDRVPDAVVRDRRGGHSQDAAAGTIARDRFTRFFDAGPGGAPSARNERVMVTRVLAESAKVVNHAFDGVARGDPVAIDRFARVIDSISEAMASSRSTMIGLSRLKLKDEYTFFHSVAVGALMLGLARDLDLDETVTRDLALGGLLHDVGKMRIPSAILGKPGPLTDAEFADMKRHVTLGHELLSDDPAIPPIALEVTLRHHERLDGGGYPDGLAGDAVSLYARMAAICDVFDALTSARAYKNAIPAHDAITMMAGWQGQFDRALLVTFMHTIGAYPVGMPVRLSSDRLGVMLPPARRAGRPRARVFHCAATDTPLPPCDVVIADAGQGERVVSEVSPQDWSIDDWPALRDRLLGGSARRAA